MVLTALRGALGFLSRLPVGRADGAWAAFAETPAAFPLAGYVVGGLAGLPAAALLAVGAPAPTVALVYLLAVYLVTGINHADGVADLGDAAAVHGDAAERREVLTDTTTGVGAVLAVALVVAGLALGALGLAALDPLRALGLAVAVEVGAKAGMAAVACLGSAAHEGFGERFTRGAGPALLLGPAVAAAPAALLTFPSPAAVAALVAAVLAALAVLGWANANLGGVNGDVFGAANELGRVAAIHAGVVVWVVV